MSLSIVAPNKRDETVETTVPPRLVRIPRLPVGNPLMHDDNLRRAVMRLEANRHCLPGT